MNDARPSTPRQGPDEPAAIPSSAGTAKASASLGSNSWRSRRIVWLAGVAVVVLAVGVWLVTANLPRLLTTPSGGTPAPTEAAADARRIHATLLFVSETGTLLAPSSHEVLYGATPAEQVKHILEAEIAPPAGQRSAVPPGTTVRSVFLTPQGEAYVDLGGAIISGHTGGSLDEALTVYTIIDAITINMPDVSRVQILIEGQAVDSLMGHLDLRRPLGKALDWIERGQ